MPNIVTMNDAEAQHPEFQFIASLTPSEQKSAFHVRDSNGRDLCLKLIAPNTDIDRLRREIEAMKAISHPNVVDFVEYTYSTGPHGVRHYVVERFVDGADMTDRLATAPWPIANVVKFFDALASGLSALHAVHIVHRDLKPSNVRVSRDGQPVIIDLGLARHLAKPDLTQTAAGAQIGTPAYFAPEQFRGTKRDIDLRTDLFAFGILMYQALVGSHPFYIAGCTAAELEVAVCDSNDALSNPEFVALPLPLQLLISKLLSKRRAGRPLNASQVVDFLRKHGGTK